MLLSNKKGLDSRCVELVRETVSNQSAGQILEFFQNGLRKLSIYPDRLNESPFQVCHNSCHPRLTPTLFTWNPMGRSSVLLNFRKRRLWDVAQAKVKSAGSIVRRLEKKIQLAIHTTGRLSSQ
jgi:hypothetical protein